MPKARLVGELDINNKPFIKGMNEAVAKGKSSGKEISGAFTKIGPALAASLSAGALISFAKSAVYLGGELADTADRLNLNIDALQGLQFAFGQSGGNAETFTKGMEKLNEELFKVQEGDEAAIKGFNDLGIEVRELIGLKPEQALYKIADAFNAMTDKQAAAAAMAEIFGSRIAGKLIPGIKDGAEALRALAAESLKLSEHQKENLDLVGDTASKVATGAKTLMGQFIAMNVDFVKSFKDVAEIAKKVTIGDIFGKGTRDIPIPKFTGEYPTADNSFEIPETPSTMGGTSARGRRLTDAESAKMDEQSEAEKKSAKEAQDSVEFRNKLEQEGREKSLKFQQQIAKVIRDGIMDGLTGEQKLNVLTAERAKMMQEAAKIGAYSEEVKLEYAEKSVEIARQIRENEKESEKDKKTAAAMQAAAAGASTSGLRTSGTRGYARSADAHSLIRRGDAARARAEKEKKEKDPAQAQSDTAYNTALLAKAFGMPGRGGAQ